LIRGGKSGATILEKREGKVFTVSGKGVGDFPGNNPHGKGGMYVTFNRRKKKKENPINGSRPLKEGKSESVYR